MILCAAAILASCTHEVEQIDQKAREEIFENNFNSTFGVSESVYANHNWGMDLMPLVDITDSTASTRSAMTRGAATRGATTRAANVNGNLWYQDWKRPTNVTDEEIAWAKEEFGKVRRNTRPWVSIEWSNYWVQQVYKGEKVGLMFGRPDFFSYLRRHDGTDNEFTESEDQAASVAAAEVQRAQEDRTVCGRRTAGVAALHQCGLRG